MAVISSIFSRALLAAWVAAAMAAAGCSSVSLDKRYDPPPVRMPSSAPTQPSAAAPATTTAPAAVPQAVTPSQPVGQPLPPVGTAPGTPVASASAAASPLVTLSARLEAAAVSPPTRSAGSGQLDVLYDRQTRLLRWKTSWHNLSGTITGVQFHGPALAGQNGPAAMVWPAPFGPTYEGRATLTPQQEGDLLQGLWYLNVMTSAYPTGEVRGQLRVVN
ncbi:CHRD domain-containing protein [Ottowia sp.]|uniref:CHRD domain-containing protein n=1 Tax=Ottowia sp. TaxID=1898956 RepID=UPI003A87C785